MQLNLSESVTAMHLLIN